MGYTYLLAMLILVNLQVLLLCKYLVSPFLRFPHVGVIHLIDPPTKLNSQKGS